MHRGFEANTNSGTHILLLLESDTGEHWRTMMHAMASREMAEEARLLFTLVDAVDCEGLIAATSFQSRWRVVKARIESGASCEEEAENLYELLSEIESSGAIRSTWVEKRWRTAAQRIHAER